MDDAGRDGFGPSAGSGCTDGWIPGERDIGFPGEGGAHAHPAATNAADGDASLAPLAQGAVCDSPQAGGGVESHVPLNAGKPQTSEELRVPLHHPADGPSHEPTVSLDPRAGEEPAPPHAPHHNQWTRAKMVAFLRELAATQSVSAAAKAVGMSRTAAYNLRNRLQGQPFALGWEVAVEMGLHHLAQAVVDRALNGEEIEHYYHGELVATSRRYDNRLAAWVLANPWAVGRQQVAREYSAGDFDALLERVENASLRWEAGEAQPGPGWPFADDDEAEEREGAFIGKGSWYVDDQAMTERVKRVRAR